MSSMIQAPPPSIPIGGPPGGGPSGPGGPPGAGGADVDPAAVKQHLKNAIAELDAAAAAEGDDPDAAEIKMLSAKLHAMVGAHQKLQDDVMGAGPGAKMIRKTGGGAPGGGAPAPGGGGY